MGHPLTTLAHRSIEIDNMRQKAGALLHTLFVCPSHLPVRQSAIPVEVPHLSPAADAKQVT